LKTNRVIAATPLRDPKRLTLRAAERDSEGRMRRSSLASLAASSLLAFACSHEPAPVAPAAAASQPPAPTITGSTASTAIDAPPAPRADGRLTALATPTHYAIALDVDPTRDRFSGRVAIDVD